MLSTQEFEQVAALYPVLGQLPAQLRSAVATDMRRVAAPAGHVLFDLDSACTMFLLPFAGSIRVIKPAITGREILLYRLEPGDSCVLTASCLLGHATYSARGVVDSDLVGYTISQAMFQRLLAESALFREFIFRYFAERVTDLMQLVEEIAFGGMDQRLANYLLERGPRIEATHQVIADELGTVREVVSRRLKQLEARKLVRLERGQIVVLDEPGLRRLAGSLRDSSH
jgi:CRP/FNR family transcriptional regulator, anaerobic regulatory protein